MTDDSELLRELALFTNDLNMLIDGFMNGDPNFTPWDHEVRNRWRAFVPRLLAHLPPHKLGEIRMTARSYQSRPEVVQAVTFCDLIAHGKESGANIVNGMPWSFSIFGRSVTHENDELYLVCDGAKTHRVGPTDMLVEDSIGQLSVVPRTDFLSRFKLSEGHSAGTETALSDPVGEVCGPNGARPYNHFVRLREPRDDEVGAKLYAIREPHRAGGSPSCIFAGGCRAATPCQFICTMDEPPREGDEK